MMNLKYIATVLIILITSDDVVKLVSNQTISPITYTIDCCHVILRSEIDPVSSGYFFEWFVIDGDKNTSLGLVGLDGNGNVLCRSSNDNNGDSNCSENTYEIRNFPPLLDPENAPFNTILKYPFNQSFCGFTFLAYSFASKQLVNVSCPTDCNHVDQNNCSSACSCHQETTPQPITSSSITLSSSLISRITSSKIISSSSSSSESTTMLSPTNFIALSTVSFLTSSSSMSTSSLKLNTTSSSITKPPLFTLATDRTRNCKQNLAKKILDLFQHQDKKEWNSYPSLKWILG